MNTTPHLNHSSAKHGTVDTYKLKIEEKIAETIPFLGPATPLREACGYALLNGGKRIRPSIVLMLADALGKGADVNPAALAVEFFHTASLVADDLPCMDDDDERRDKPSLHKVYGETAALLVSYALIASGYECLAKNAQLLKSVTLPHASYSDHICVLALENATLNTGLWGATGGQFLDIYPPDLSLHTLREVLHKKTVSLFEIAFVCGWAYGGGDLHRMDFVKKAASHFGMAFQLADDLDDVEQDVLSGRKVNMAAVFGVPEATRMFHEEIEGYIRLLDVLHIKSPPLLALADVLKASIL